jgi:RNA polymerase sigma factor (sigma-70 family)
MPASHARLLQYLRRLASQQPSAPATDGALLERFARHRDEEGFAALFARHRPMVLRVCRRVLADAGTVEDAGQAVFLVLARRPSAVRPPEALAAWLHGVAYRVALKARAADTRRLAREPPAPDLAPPDPHGDPLAELTARELLTALDEEVRLLPQVYRLPLILCCLEGRTQEEAARQLGWTPGSVKGRLERGRARLHARLVRRGLTLSAALAAVEVSRGGAAMPALLATATLRAGLAVAAGQGLAAAGVSGRVAALAEGALKGMTMSKVNLGLVLLLAVGAAAAGTGVLAHCGPAKEQPEAGQAAGPPPVAPEAARARPEAQRPVRADRYGDPLPDGALARLGTVRFRQGGGTVNRLLPSTDGKRLVSKSYYGERTVCIWDLASGKLLRQLPGHYEENRAVALSPDGKTVAVGQDATVHFYDLATGREVRRLEGTVGETQGLAFSPDGKSLASGHGGRQVLLWDLAGGKIRARLPARHNRSGLLAFSPDGKTLATGDTLNAVLRLFDVTTGKERHQLKRPSFVHDFAFSPDGATLAAGAQDGVISLWDPTTGKLVRELRSPYKHVRAVAWSPDGETLAAGEFDEKGKAGYVRLWDPATGTQRRHLKCSRGLVESLAFTVDGKTLVSGGRDSVIRLWDAATGEERSPAAGYDGPVWWLAVSPDGKTLAYSGQDICLWDLAAGREAGTLQGNHWSFAFSADGKTLAGGIGENTVNVWDMSSRRIVRRLETDPKQDGLEVVAYYRVAFSPDGKMLASSGRGLLRPGKAEGVIRLWDVASGKEGRRLECKAGEEFFTVEGGLAFSPDGRTLAASGRAGGYGSMVWLWDVRTGKELTALMATLNGRPEDKLAGPAFFEPRVVFSPDGRLLAMQRGEKGIPVCEAVTGRERCRLEGRGGATACVAFSPDGRTLAAAGDDGTIRLWDVEAAKELRRLTGHRGKANALAFTPDGKTLISAGDDTTVLFWDVTAVTARDRPAERLRPKDLDALWADLCGPDAAKAHRAMARLSAAPSATVPALKKWLRPTTAADAARLAKLLRDLDSDEFAVREKASRELEWLGDTARATLERERGGAALSLELRRRLDRLLEQLQVPSGERLGELRAAEVLERIGGPGAREVLEALAKGTPEARLTRDAKASLERLARRGTGSP